jgi:hypothetical protein
MGIGSFTGEPKDGFHQAIDRLNGTELFHFVAQLLGHVGGQLLAECSKDFRTFNGVDP